jgi:hypothetical protein
MELLTTPKELEKKFGEAMRRYHHFRWCVAWASSGFPLCDEVLSRRDQISQLVIGIHFYQTHPEFLEALKDHRGTRVILLPKGIFHPNRLLKNSEML